VRHKRSKCETQICFLLDLLPSKTISIINDHAKGFVSRVERISSSIVLDLAQIAIQSPHLSLLGPTPTSIGNEQYAPLG
jgi:hypothetical protein